MEELEEILERMKNPSTRLCEKEELKKSLPDSDICTVCGGNEWIFIVDNGVEMVKPCDCRKKAIMLRRLRFANIPESFKDLSLKAFRADIYQKLDSKKVISDACQIIKTYIETFASQKESGMGLYMWSNTKGSGKTRMAAGLANELLKNYSVKFAVSMAIIQEIKATWGKNAEYSESKLIEDLCNTEILIIDDFGVEAPAGWINDRFYQIINERYVNKKVTIFTSNDSLENLKYDERIINRIKEKTYQIAFPEESVREIIAKKNQEEMIKKVCNI